MVNTVIESTMRMDSGALEVTKGLTEALKIRHEVAEAARSFIEKHEHFRCDTTPIVPEVFKLSSQLERIMGPAVLETKCEGVPLELKLAAIEAYSAVRLSLAYGGSGKHQEDVGVPYHVTRVANAVTALKKYLATNAEF